MAFHLVQFRFVTTTGLVCLCGMFGVFRHIGTGLGAERNLQLFAVAARLVCLEAEAENDSKKTLLGQEIRRIECLRKMDCKAG